MKRINTYILSALAALSFVAVSCDVAQMKEDHLFKKGGTDLEGCYGVAFPSQEASGSHTYDPTAEKEVTFTVSRQETAGAITVPVIVTESENGIFNVPDITFADGQAETDITVTFPNVKTGVKYSLTLQVADPQYASIYSELPASIVFDVTVVEWKSFGKGTLAYAACLSDGGPFTQDTELMYYDMAAENWRYCYLKDAVPAFADDVKYEFYWNTNTDQILVPHQYSGYSRSSDNAGIWFGCASDFYNAYYGWGEVPGTDSYFDWSIAWMKKNEFLIPFYDGNGGFYLADWWYLAQGDVPTGSGYQFGGDSEKDCDLFIAEGFVRTDFTIQDIEADYTVEGVAPIYVYTGRDVDELKYVAVDGELTATQANRIIEEIVEGKREGVESIKDFYYIEDEDINEFDLGLQFETTGAKTVVVVSYGKGEAYDDTFLSFNYIAKGDAEEYAVDITVGTEKTPARYTSMTEYDSFAFFVAGKDIAEAHIAVVETAKFMKNVQYYLASLKYEADPVEDEVLDQINEEGGFYSVQGGLNDGTSYTLLVWATNGDSDTVISAEWTTTENPEPFKLLGKATVHDSALPVMFGMKPVNYQVDIYESEETAGKYRIVNLLGESYPYNDPGDWNPTVTVNTDIYAMDPAHVYVLPTEQATSWNSSYGNFIFTSTAGRYIAAGYPIATIEANGIPFGTMSNNVISFPEGGVLIGLSNMGKYYDPSEEPYTITLPAAAKTSVLSNVAAPAKKEFKGGPALRPIQYNFVEREASNANFTTVKIAPKGHREKEMNVNNVISLKKETVR